jgi:hypothetical protein
VVGTSKIKLRVFGTKMTAVSICNFPTPEKTRKNGPNCDKYASRNVKKVQKPLSTSSTIFAIDFKLLRLMAQK